MMVSGLYKSGEWFFLYTNDSEYYVCTDGHIRPYDALDDIPNFGLNFFGEPHKLLIPQCLIKWSKE